MDNDELQHPSMSNEWSHEEVSSLLHAYAHAILIGELPEAQYPHIAFHLTTCGSCQDSLAELLEVTMAAADYNIAPLHTTSRPNLSRLKHHWEQQRAQQPWFIDRLGQLWLLFSEELLRSWQASSLLGSARGSMLYSYSSEGQRESVHQAQESIVSSLHIDIIAEQDQHTVAIVVSVELLERDAFEQSGIHITLYQNGGTSQATTDPTGMVVFTNILRESLASLQIAIKVDQSA